MNKETRTIKNWLLFFMVSLVLSGLTAIPIEWELSQLIPFFSPGSTIEQWLSKVSSSLKEGGNKYPFYLYGFDWLAFAHIVIAISFIGPYKDPVRNKWVIEFAIYACLLVIPFALIAGQFRGIPFWWRLIDCAFGVFGLIPLVICYKKIQQLEKNQIANNNFYNTIN